MMRTVKSLVGPEAIAPYEVAHAAGRKMFDMPTATRNALMEQGLAQAQEHVPALAQAPITGPLQRAMGHELAGTQPQAQAKGLLARGYSGLVNKATNVVNRPFDTPLQRGVKNVAGVAPLAGALVADPVGMVAHVGVNTARDLAGNSRMGERAGFQLLERGMKGQYLKPGMEKLIDYAFSPALLDPFRIGAALHQSNAYAAPATQGFSKFVPQGTSTYDHVRNLGSQLSSSFLPTR